MPPSGISFWAVVLIDFGDSERESEPEPGLAAPRRGGTVGISYINRHPNR